MKRTKSTLLIASEACRRRHAFLAKHFNEYEERVVKGPVRSMLSFPF